VCTVLNKFCLVGIQAHHSWDLPGPLLPARAWPQYKSRFHTVSQMIWPNQLPAVRQSSYLVTGKLLRIQSLFFQQNFSTKEDCAFFIIFTIILFLLCHGEKLIIC
jgi:hypothetical protein